MGQLVMSFLGICLHVSKEAQLPPGVGHRVVAVDASNPMKDVWRSIHLPPHYCYLDASKEVREALVDAGIPVGEHLRGWRMSVVNPMPLRVDLTVPPIPPARLARREEDSLTAVPRLDTYSPGMTLREDLLHDGPPAVAAFFVDITAGSVVADQFSGGGVYTTWSVETDGKPELQFTSRDGRSVTVTIPSTPPGAQLGPTATMEAVPGSLALHNSTHDKTDTRFDFALHYLARDGGIPDVFDGLLPGEDNDVVDDDVIGMSTSCSNSRYP